MQKSDERLSRIEAAFWAQWNKPRAPIPTPIPTPHPSSGDDQGDWVDRCGWGAPRTTRLRNG